MAHQNLLFSLDLGQSRLEGLSCLVVVLDAKDPFTEHFARLALLCLIFRSEGRLLLGQLSEPFHSGPRQSVFVVLT